MRYHLTVGQKFAEFFGMLIIKVLVFERDDIGLIDAPGFDS